MTKTQNRFDPTTQRNVDQWLSGDYDQQTKETIVELIKQNPEEITDAFYTSLSFGTGGLRGIMGVGSNRMNIYTIRKTTQGLANYILRHQQEGKNGVFIGYDSRLNSQQFAQEAAQVLAANDIPVYFCAELRPVPYVSFGCRFKNCQAAIMITASHNPAQYNGYKVYWSDGAQVVPPHDTGVMEEVHKIVDSDQVKRVDSPHHPLIKHVIEEVDSAYLEAMASWQHYPEENQKDGDLLKITYTSLHGTGITLAPQAFKRWGFQKLSYVEKQIIPDGHFPTVTFPNPEEPSALKLGIETMRAQGSDLLIATDPDADRVGIVVCHQADHVRLTGNQVACLCLEHICHALHTQNKLSDNAACIKTIVTTELFQAIADAYHVCCFNVLTGFKYIAEKIHQWEQQHNPYQFLFGAEESYGYLLGTYARDKDAIVSSTLIAEMALQAKKEGKTLIDKLNALYQKYGFYAEELLALTFPETKEGRGNITKGITKLQHSPPTHLLNKKIISIEDYHRSVKVDLETGKTETLQLPSSNVLTFWLEDQTKLIVRPSGTEPKIKLYCGTVGKEFSECQTRAKDYIQSLCKIIS